MNEEVVEHLRLIQAVVARHEQNSFASKGWAVLVVTAIFALSSKDPNPISFLVALIPTLTFWGLDAYYLRQERLFRKLYDAVRSIDPSDLSNNPFSMDTLPYTYPDFPETMAQNESRVKSWWGTCWSRTVAWLYGSIVFTILVATMLAHKLR